MQDQWNHKIFEVTKQNFDALALEIFQYQLQHNAIYSEYVKALGISVENITSVDLIPFLPIRFFKSHPVQTTSFAPQLIFESSGTTGAQNSRHIIKDLSVYEESFRKGFELFYGQIEDWCVIGLLPSYLERQHSSLVYMVDNFIKQSNHSQSGFYLYEFDKLHMLLTDLENKKQKTLLIGVTYALLDFAEKFPIHLKNTVVMETGGMKGRRIEMIRPEVHKILKDAFQVPFIHSEYGMTELLTQAYSKGEGVFNCPPWMKVLVREDEDPLAVNKIGTGAVNVIDLANVYSCSFIATDDAGRVFGDESFEILGRMDGSDLRGCGLMVV